VSLLYCFLRFTTYVYMYLPLLYRFEKQIFWFECCLQKTKSKLFSITLCVNKCISICICETDWSSYDGGYENCSLLVDICRRFGGKYCLTFKTCIREILVRDIGCYWLRFFSFPQSIQVNAEKVFLLGNDNYLPNPFKFINNPII
jgi:hypothetical protein